MIIRATDHSVEELSLRTAGYDYCLVGAGIIGVSLAVHLAGLGHRVLLLETGDFEEDVSLADNYSGSANDPHPAPQDYRRQRLGGTSHLWGGRCIPLDIQDFEVRAHVPRSGWPVSADEISPFIQQAHDILDVGISNYSLHGLAEPHAELWPGLGLHSPDLIENIERYSLPTDVGRKYREKLNASENILVVLRARVVDLDFDTSSERVLGAAVLVGNSTQAFHVSAPEFVLCGGGIETTRLMLCVRQRQATWARFDSVLGKYYGCHYDLITGELQLKQGRPRFFFEKTTDGIYARRKLQFSSAYQAKHGLYNAAFRLHFQPYANAAHGSAVLSLIYLLKSILPREHQDILNHGRDVLAQDKKLLDHLRNMVSDFVSIPGFGWEWLTKMKLAQRRLPYTLIAPRSGKYPFDFNSEQEPSAQNQITLTTARDSQNVPRVAIQWQLTAKDVESGRRNFIHLQEKINSTNHAHLRLDMHRLESQLGEARPIGGHHMGATRMGLSPRDSVVNRDLRVHGMQNLRIASASIFPTFGAANPTLSLLAVVLWAFRTG